MEYLTTHLDQLRRGHRNSLTVAAGDLIGGSPFLSGLFKDEPSVESLDNLGLDVSSVGNHEFDEGVTELLRMQYGGCHPVEGCFDADGYSGADFPWLAANVTYRDGVRPVPPAGSKKYGSWWRRSSTGRTVLPPTAVRRVDGVKVGFIGMTLEGTPEVVAAAGIRDVQFRDEVVTANAAAGDLRRRGVQAIVVLLHEGGLPPSGAAYDYDCNAGGAAALSGPIVDHRAGPGPVDRPGGHRAHPPAVHLRHPRPGREPALGDQRVVVRPGDHRHRAEARPAEQGRDPLVGADPVNVAVTRDVPKDADQSATIAKWAELAAPVANRVVGSITENITRGPGNARDGEPSSVT